MHEAGSTMRSGGGKSLGDVLDTLLKKALKHHIIIIADMIFLIFYIYFIDNLIAVIKDTSWHIQIIVLLTYIAGLIAPQYLISKQLKSDTTIEELMAKEEDGSMETIKRK